MASRREGFIPATEGGVPPTSKRNLTVATALIPEVIPPGSDRSEGELKLFLEKAAVTIRDKHDKLFCSVRNSVRHALSIGNVLIKVKGRLSHGKFEDWVVQNCVFSTRSARNYMCLARGGAKLSLEHDANRQSTADLTSIDKVLKQLAKPRPRTKSDDDASTAASATTSGQAEPERDEEDHDQGDGHSRRGNDEEDAAATTHRDGLAESSDASGVGEDVEEETVTSNQEQAKFGTESQEHVDPEAHHSDGEWLANLPVRRRLANPARFDSDALFYRRSLGPIRAVRQVLESAPEDMPKIADPAEAAKCYRSLIAFAAAVKHPRDWPLCANCDGLGIPRSRSRPCGNCVGGGYEISFHVVGVDESPS